MSEMDSYRGQRMKEARWWAVALMLCTFTTLSAAQKKICIGAISGGDAVTWNIQQPLLKAIATEASSRGVSITTQLLTASYEQQARGEMASYGCDYALMTSVGREWPTPKAGSGINGGGGAKDEDKPHPVSTARFHYVLLDKSAKRVDKLDKAIEMQQGYTAKNVDAELQEMIQSMANLVVDDTTAQ
jgi:hypothetical protein